MNGARIVVPILIAVFVLYLTGQLSLDEQPPSSADESLRQGVDEWFPLKVGLSWVYDADGTYQARRRGEQGRSMSTLTRTILRSRSDSSYQVVESVDEQVVDNYLVRRTKQGIELASLGMDRRTSLYLPQDFGPGVTWNLSAVRRATADQEETELHLNDLGTVSALRVRYERYHGEKVTLRPDWFFDGYRWFGRGLGLVREDLRDIQRPRRDGSIEYLETWEIRTLRLLVEPGE